jgi:hypothetical protein
LNSENKTLDLIPSPSNVVGPRLNTADDVTRGGAGSIFFICQHLLWVRGFTIQTLPYYLQNAKILTMADSNATTTRTSDLAAVAADVASAPRCEPNPAWMRNDSDIQEIKSLIYGLKRGDPLGMTWLSDDGVLHSLTGDRDVLDAVGLSPRQITAYKRHFFMSKTTF